MDRAIIGKLQGQLEGLADLPSFTRYRDVEVRIVALQDIRTRFEQVAEKYAAAAHQDVALRQRRREDLMSIHPGLGRFAPP